MISDEYLQNAIRRIVSSMIGQMGQPRLGTVSSVNPANHSARVMIQPEGVLSGWLPIGTMMAGGGWGAVSLPSPGEQVLLVPAEGNTEHSIIVSRLFSQAALPPKTYVDQTQQGDTSNGQPGEFLFAHESGSFMRLTSDGNFVIKGNVQINGTLETTQTITSDEDVIAKGDFNATGEAGAGRGNMTTAGQVKDFHNTLDNLRQTYNGHNHGLDSHGDSEGPPVQQD